MRKSKIKFLLTLGIVVYLFIILPNCFVDASEIKEIKAEVGIKNIKVSWPIVNLSETESIILIRKEGSCPKSYQDGQEIYRGNGHEFEDINVSKDKKYCYATTVYDFSGKISDIKKTGLVEKIGKGEYLARILISKNNFFIIIEAIIFLVLIGINLKKRGFFEKKSRFKVLRVDEE